MKSLQCNHPRMSVGNTETEIKMEKGTLSMQMEQDAINMLACLHPVHVSESELAVVREHVRLAVQAVIDEYLKDVAERPEDTRMAYIAAITAIAASGTKRLREFQLQMKGNMQ